MAELKEQIWLYRIRAFGDHKAFDQIHREYKDAVRRFLAAKLPSPQDTDDALSTTFLRLWNYLRSARVEHLSGLIFTIARSVIAEFYRNRKSLSVNLEAPEAVAASGDQGEGVRHIERTAQVALMREKLSRLSDNDQQLVLLHYFEGLSIRMIADQLGKKENTVRVALLRAMERLRGLVRTGEEEES